MAGEVGQLVREIDRSVEREIGTSATSSGLSSITPCEGWRFEATEVRYSGKGFVGAKKIRAEEASWQQPAFELTSALETRGYCSSSPSF